MLLMIKLECVNSFKLPKIKGSITKLAPGKKF